MDEVKLQVSSGGTAYTTYFGVIGNNGTSVDGASFLGYGDSNRNGRYDAESDIYVGTAELLSALMWQLGTPLLVP